jgi:hypothetical protein
LILDCEHCQAKVSAEFVAKYERRGEEEDDYPDSVHLLKCPRCANPLLVSVDDIVNDGEQFVMLYPSTAAKASASVPAPLRRAFDEATLCLRAKAYTAAAIMCRKAVEGVCVKHGVKSKGLVAGLKELRERGVIEGRLFSWADALRMQGNEAAHDVRVTTSPEDARDLVDFAHALLEYVFTFNDKFKAFEARKAKRGGAS